MSEILSVENVTRQFGGLTAVNAVSFTVNKGDITGLIGPNGAGKTTLFNMSQAQRVGHVSAHAR